jgi:multidrug transporter EmrE-like cation transporter
MKMTEIEIIGMAISAAPIILVVAVFARFVLGGIYRNMSKAQTVIAAAVLIGVGASLISSVISLIFKDNLFFLTLFAILITVFGIVLMAKETR